MKSNYANSRLEKIELIFRLYNAISIDELTLSHIAKYLTVLTSGTYEDIIKNFIIEYADKNRVPRELREYIFNQTKRSFRNPDFGNLIGLIGLFSKNWADETKLKINDAQKDSLNSIVANKNQIAHGGNCNITFSDIQNYYFKSKEIIVYLDNLFLH